MGITSATRLQDLAGTTVETKKGVGVRRKDCYGLFIDGKCNVRTFWKKAGFTVNRKNEKLADIVSILEQCQSSRRRAIEWIK